VTIPKKPAKVTEAQVCRYLGNNLDVLKEEAKRYICEEIDELTSNELFDRFWDGRREYGGEFDVEAIPCREELFREAMDVVWYVTFLKHQREQ